MRIIATAKGEDQCQDEDEDETPTFNTRQERIDLLKRIQNYLTSKFAVSCGRDTDDKEYDSLVEFWSDRGLLSSDRKHADDDGNDDSNDDSNDDDEPKWYKRSHDYWQNQTNAPATIDGMLGGFSVLTERDLIASKIFVETILQTQVYCQNISIASKDKDTDPNGSSSGSSSGRDSGSRSCECGAGIGRVTKGLMIPLGITSCDLVETSPRLLKYAPEYIGKNDVTKCNFICQGLQDFNPEEGIYDIIWIQWVIGYLTDWDLVSFFNRMGKALRKGGVIVIKDNSCNEMAFLADCNDSDITRSFQYLMGIIEESDLMVVKDTFGNKLIKWQDDFPDNIWPVPMIALTNGMNDT